MTKRKNIVLDMLYNKNSQIIPVDFMPSRKKYHELLNYFGFDNERKLLNELDSDFYYLSVRDISQNENFYKCYKSKKLISDDIRECAFGIRYKRGAYDSKFSVDESIYAPLGNCDSTKDLLSYKWPTKKDFDFSLLLDEAIENADRAIVGGLWTGIMGDAYRLIGFEKFLYSLIEKPEFVHTLINKLTEVYLDLNDLYFSTMKGNIDIWFFGNDFGGQQSMLMSETMWCDFFVEPITQLCHFAHSKGLKIMMHSCGSIVPIIKHLIDAGVDILDPVQVTAKGMIPEKLVESFGDKLIFHGGIDTQKILPFGTAEEIEQHIKHNVSVFSRKSKYIASGSQILGDDIPLSNILLTYKVLKEINKAKNSCSMFN